MTLQQLDVFNCKVSAFSQAPAHLLRQSLIQSLRQSPAQSSAQQTAVHPPKTYQPRTRQSSRQRGVVLTEQGWNQMMTAKILQNNNGEWHTYELLGDRTLLSPRTVSKIISRDVGVDRRTLQQFFEALDLFLQNSDYRLTSQSVSESMEVPHKAVR